MRLYHIICAPLIAAVSMTASLQASAQTGGAGPCDPENNPGSNACFQEFVAEECSTTFSQIKELVAARDVLLASLTDASDEEVDEIRDALRANHRESFEARNEYRSCRKSARAEFTSKNPPKKGKHDKKEKADGKRTDRQQDRIDQRREDRVEERREDRRADRREDRVEERREDRREDRAEDRREDRVEERREDRRADRVEDRREERREDRAEERREDRVEERREDRREDRVEDRREDRRADRVEDRREERREDRAEERREDRKEGDGEEYPAACGALVESLASLNAARDTLREQIELASRSKKQELKKVARSLSREIGDLKQLLRRCHDKHK